jgi:quinoprotein glucose dehydrogenase
MFVIAAGAAAADPADRTIADWPSYAGDAGGSRYSPLAQIDKSNVAELKVAWEYHTGDVSDGGDGRRKSAFEATPIVADGSMYLSTPFNRVVALDPETGRETWSFDPKIDLRGPYSEGLINRGVTLWTDPGRAEGDACRRRIFLATIDARLFALDAATGRPCNDFGSAGQIDLTRGIANITRRGEYEETSAPAVADDLVIVGSGIADNDRVDRAGSSEPLTRAPALCAGAGTRSPRASRRPARAMPGRRSPSTPGAISSLCRPRVPAPTITA